jgi:hypothetical protein
MAIGIKQGFKGGEEYLSSISGFIGNPIALSIAIMVLLIFVLLFAMLLMKMGSNKWKLFSVACVAVIICVPIGVAGYELCRKNSLDEKYLKTKQQFVAPPSQFFGRGPVAPVVAPVVAPPIAEVDGLSDYASIEDWFANSDQ